MWGQNGELDMRLIDADKLGLTDFEIVMCNGSYKEALQLLLDKINSAEVIGVFSTTEHNNGWIPVSERLPEEHKNVLLYFKSGRYCPHNPFQIGHIGTHEIEDHFFEQIGVATVWYTNNYYYDFDQVAAWMPLPDPYKAEVNDEID